MIFTKNFNNKSRTQVTPIKGWAYNVSKSAVVNSTRCMASSWKNIRMVSLYTKNLVTFGRQLMFSLSFHITDLLIFP